MNVDRQYRIRIDLQTDASGAAVAQGALDKTGEAAEKAGGHMREMHRVVHALNEAVPGLGFAMQAAFSPMGAGIGIAVMLLRQLHEWEKANKEAMDKLAEEGAKPLTHRLDAMRDAIVNANVGLGALNGRLEDAARAEESISKTTEQATERLKQQFTTMGTLGEAMKEYELANLNELHRQGLISEEDYARQKIQIEIEFAAKKRQVQEGEEMAEIMARRRVIEDAQADQERLVHAAEDAELKKTKALEDLASLRTREEVKADKEMAGKQLLDWDKQHGDAIARAQAAVKRDIDLGYGKPGATAEEAYGLTLDRARLAPLAGEREKLQAAADLARRQWEQAPGIEAKKKVAADAATRASEHAAKLAEENERFVTEQQRENERARSQFNARKSADAQLAGYEDQARWLNAGIQPPDPRASLTGALGAYRASEYSSDALHQVAAELGSKYHTDTQVIINMLRALLQDIRLLEPDVKILQTNITNRTNVGGGQ